MHPLIELTTSRHNPMIDPSFSIWGWQIAVYLFLGGLVAGLMIIAGVRLLVTRPTQREAMICCTLGPILGLIGLSLGMFALFLDLGHKLYVWRLYLTFQITSPMSWGSWILMLVYPALLANALTHLPEALPVLAKRFPVLVSISDAILARPRLVIGIGLANVLVGIALGTYTGILLSTLAGRPLWNSALLGPLFLFSGLSAAAALLHGILILSLPEKDQPEFVDFLISSFRRVAQSKPSDQKIAPVLAGADNSFLTIEFAILCLVLIGHMSSSVAHRQAASLLLTGPWAAPFWVLIIGMGIAMPLTLQTLELFHRIRHTIAPSLLVLFGSLALRFILVYAGQDSSWPQTLNQ